MEPDDEPSFFRARCPLTGVRAKTVAMCVIAAQRHHGAEIVPVAGAPLEEQIARASDNVRRAVAMLCARHPAGTYLQRARTAVEASETFCVAVALSADEIEARRASRN
jgi:hypothetical protein